MPMSCPSAKAILPDRFGIWVFLPCEAQRQGCSCAGHLHSPRVCFLPSAFVSMLLVGLDARNGYQPKGQAPSSGGAPLSVLLLISGEVWRRLPHDSRAEWQTSPLWVRPCICGAALAAAFKGTTAVGQSSCTQCLMVA